MLFAVYSFLVGTAFGSFALVLADRMHAGKDWVRGRSVCDHCGHKLGPRDLVPLVSWVASNGRCRYCEQRIAPTYPAVELALGSAFLVSYLFAPYELQGLGLVLLGLWLFGLVIMMALVVSDLKWYLLPSKLVYPLVGVAAVHRVVQCVFEQQGILEAVAATMAALLIASGLFWALNFISNGRWIGDGDYRLGLAIGLYLGDPLLAWMTLFFASVFGLVIIAPALVKKKNRLKLKIPFGPFLILGLMWSYIIGERLLSWYLDTFLYL